MTRDNTTASGDRPARRSGAGLSTRRALNHRASSPRVRLLSLVLCCAVLLPSSLFASGPKSASPGVRKTPATTPARQTQTSPAGLPDLNEARRRPAREPHAVPPVPSTRRRCPPRDRRCNDNAGGSPTPSPTPTPSSGQARGHVPQAGTTGISVAAFAGQSFLALVSAALNGGRPVTSLSVPDFYGFGGGYSVTDAPLASLPFVAALFLDPPTSLHVTSTTDTQVSLAWTPPSSGATNYRVERSTDKSWTTPGLAGTSATTGFTDGGRSRAQAYLYRVCAADGANNCVSPYSNVAMATAITFQDDPIVTATDHQNNQYLDLPLTPVRAAHVTDLRAAIDGVRALAGLSGAQWAVSDQILSNHAVVMAAHVQELRDRLGEALAVLGIPAPSYTDPGLGSAPAGTVVIQREHFKKLRDAATRGVSSGSGASYDFSTTRLNPDNRTGGEGADPLSRNYSWSIPLVGLAGRAGLDLGLTLSYNSLVWTKDATGSAVTFDADSGSPSPGFRLGFPVVQPAFFNPQTGKSTYLLVTPSGSRVELRQTATPGVYESADSSYLQLTDGGGSLTLLSSDGTRLSFYPFGGEYRCYQVEDRNGNYLSVAYYSDGRINSVTDTLGRTLTFNYDAYQNLISITQLWKWETEAAPNGVDETHVWATFGYQNLTLQPLFTNLTIVGDQPGSVIPVVNQVGLADGSYYRFSYNDWGQVWKVTHFASDSNPALDNHALSSTWLNLPGAGASPGGAGPVPATSQSDCPRFTEERAWVENGVMAQSAEVVTSYSPWSPDMAECDVTPPISADTVTFKEFYATSGWQKGLTTSEEAWVNGVKKRWASTTWTQDDTTAGYPINPRATDTTISDDQGNNRHSTTGYYSFTLPDGAMCNLPQEVTEYATADISTPLRTTRTEYNLGSQYLSERLIGLPSNQYLYEGTSATGVLRSKVGYVYDDNTLQNYLQALPSAATQHDAAGYGTSFRWRGNPNRVRRYELNPTSGAETGNFTESTTGYNITGTVAFAADAAGHQVGINYADSFYQGVNRSNQAFQTYAYPTTLTDADNNLSYVQYNYDFGAKTRVQGPPPANQPNGVIQSFIYDGAERVERETTVNNGAYARYLYGASYVVTLASVNTVADESYTNTVFDGAGRTMGVASLNPGSTGGYKAQLTQYDVMGRTAKQSNPAEIDGNWNPAGDDSAGWLYTQQSYDWKGRPLVTTNTDGTQRSASYNGCGCAGGEIVTLTDEVGRRQKVYSDSLGRQWKTEVLNWDGSVYATTESTLNARDQATLVRQFQGTDANGVYQDTTMGYDGYGRLQSEHGPEQDAGAATTYTYNANDTVQTVTDARGATTTYGYNNRHLVTGITYGGAGITAAPVTFAYDAAGNRLWMDDGPGRVDYAYDSLSRLQSETRQLDGVGSFSFSYAYNLADQLTGVTDNTFGTSFTSSYDPTGLVNGVTGTGYGGVSQFLAGASYRAWGGAKTVSYGNGRQQVLSYDQQMRISHATIAGVMDRSFQYYADGRVQYSHDFINNKHDRSYGYDQVGRRTYGFTGFEARPGGVSSEGWGPYRQTYDYDTWGNMTGRTWLTWFTTPEGSTVPQSNSYSASYTNNRLTSSMNNGNTGTSWLYDAEGGLTRSTSRSTSQTSTYLYNFDQAGQLASTAVQTVTTAEVDSTTEQAFDGDGRRVMYYDSLNPIDGSNHTLYFVRSTALDGQILVEVNPAGQKQRAYVYAGGSPLATQEGTGAQVRWEHRDPTNVSIYWTYTDSSVSAGEYDPLGVSAPEVPGLTVVNNPPYNSGSFGTPDMGCNVDRIPTPCSEARRWLASGVAVPCPHNDCDPQHVVGEDEHGNPHGAWEVWNGSGNWVSDGKDSDWAFADDLTDDPSQGLIGYFAASGKGKGKRGRRRPVRSPSPGFKPTPAPPATPAAIPSSNPQGLPPCAQKYLSKFYDPALLNAIRYSTDGTPAWVPKHYKIFGEAGAFTLGDHVYFKDVMEFNPSDGISDSEMIELGHEIEHSVQYRQNGWLWQAAKYLAGTYRGAAIGSLIGPGYISALAYHLNGLELDAIRKQKQIGADLQANGNPCK